MYSFEYVRPSTVAEASKFLAENADARPLAGGMSLLPALKLRLDNPTCLVDLSMLDSMKGIDCNDGVLTIGAMTRHSEVSFSKAVKEAIPSLSALAEGIGDRQVRNRGTIGGSIANSDPTACYPSAVVGLDATIVTSKSSYSSDEFFLDLFETALEVGELVTQIKFPIPRRSAYVKFCQPASRFALVGVFASMQQNGAVRVAVTGAAASVFRVEEFERALTEDFNPDSIQGISVDIENLNFDNYADAEYRGHLISVLTRRAVQQMQEK